MTRNMNKYTQKGRSDHYTSHHFECRLVPQKSKTDAINNTADIPTRSDKACNDTMLDLGCNVSCHAQKPNILPATAPVCNLWTYGTTLHQTKKTGSVSKTNNDFSRTGSFQFRLPKDSTFCRLGEDREHAHYCHGDT